MAGLMVQTLAHGSCLPWQDERNGGRLPSRVVFYCDEFGTMPPLTWRRAVQRPRSLPVVSHWYPSSNRWRSWRKITCRKAPEILTDNVRDTMLGGTAPKQSGGGATLQSLGSRTVMSARSAEMQKNSPVKVCR